MPEYVKCVSLGSRAQSLGAYITLGTIYKREGGTIIPFFAPHLFEAASERDYLEQEKRKGGTNPLSPQHYSRWKIEPLTFIMQNNLPFWMGNVIKYIMRWDAKNGLEDLKKARSYLDKKIAELEEADA